MEVTFFSSIHTKLTLNLALQGELRQVFNLTTTVARNEDGGINS